MDTEEEKPLEICLASEQGGNGKLREPATANKMAEGFQSYLKYISLVLLTAQNATLILLMRYVRTRGGDMFKSTTAVILSELLKVIASLLIMWRDEGFSIKRWLKYLYDNIVLQKMDCVKIAVPAVIYVLQNNLLYVAVSNLEAATFQVTYQAKILTTALFSVLMLNKQLSRLQWIALTLLFIGISIVQLQPHDAKVKDVVKTEQNPLLGLIAVIVSCFMSGFAGVYFEKILKGTKQSLWLRNVQLGTYGIVIGFVTMFINDGAAVQKDGFFFGYDWVVWCLVALQSFGGLMVAVVVKYADNILKGFASSAAIILSSVASIYFFDFNISWQFITGASLVISAVYVYSKFPKVIAPLMPHATKLSTV